MPEPKQSAASVADILKREADLANARNALKEEIASKIEAHLSELKTLGFFYTLVEGNGQPKKLGRPRKEAVDGKAQMEAGRPA